MPKSELTSILIGFYEDDELVAAKELMYEVAEGIEPKIDGLLRLVILKEGTNKRRLDCEDLLQLLEILDKKVVTLPEFHALNIQRLPKISPSEVDSVQLADIVVLLRQQVAELSCQLNELKQSLSENYKQQLLSLSQEVAVLKCSVSSWTASDHSSAIVDGVTQPAAAGEEVVLNHDEYRTTTSSTFTSLFQSKDDQGQWFVVSKKKSKPTIVNRKIHGKGVVTSSLKAVPYSSEKKQQTWHFFVSRLNPETNEEDVSKHLEDAGISVTSCRLLKKKEKWQEKFSAFKVVVDYAHKDLIFEADLWPEGTDVRDWVFSSSRHG